jgi:RHS repeat-associated protein
MYDFLYREYHWIQGRWIEPDPAGLAAVDPANPQTWNRYAYVANNPLSLVDPLGLYQVVPETNMIVGDKDGEILCFDDGSCVQWNAESQTWEKPPEQTEENSGSEEDSGSGSGQNLTILPLHRIVLPGPQTQANDRPVAVRNPCQYQGRALPPSAYAASGKAANGSPVNFALDVIEGWPRGHYLDAQPLASGTVFERQAYGNYVFGVYMQAAGVPLSVALTGANDYAALTSSYPSTWSFDQNYPFLPSASVANITNGYNAQMNGTACHE